MLHWGVPTPAVDTLYFPPVPPALPKTALSALLPPPAPAPPCPPVCQFSVPYRPTSPGEAVVICGSVPELGSWDPEKGLKLTWHDGHNWRGRVEMPADTIFEAKVRAGGDGCGLREGAGCRVCKGSRVWGGEGMFRCKGETVQGVGSGGVQGEKGNGAWCPRKRGARRKGGPAQGVQRRRVQGAKGYRWGRMPSPTPSRPANPCLPHHCADCVGGSWRPHHLRPTSTSSPPC